MSNKTNDEKLRILQERLDQIRQRKVTSSTPPKPQNDQIEAGTIQNEINKDEKNKTSFGWIKYFATFFVIGFVAFSIYNKFYLNSTVADEAAIETVNIVENNIEYKLNLKGDNIVIIATFEEEEITKSKVKELRLKGFKSNYFYLPNKSNSTEKVYKVFIGPYEHKEEANQWTENIELDFEVIKL